MTWLQRHPLIDPIFPHPRPLPRGKGGLVSAPFARRNLHLVVSLMSLRARWVTVSRGSGRGNRSKTQPLILRYSIFNPASTGYIGADFTRAIGLSQVEDLAEIAHCVKSDI